MIKYYVNPHTWRRYRVESSKPSDFVPTNPMRVKTGYYVVKFEGEIERVIHESELFATAAEAAKFQKELGLTNEDE